MRPYDVKTERQLLDLQKDNKGVKEAWIMLGVNRVTVCTQRSGEPAADTVSMPRGQFNRLVDWYLKDQKSRKKK